MMPKFDVVIGGAGFAGLSLAIALRQSLGPGFSTIVADPALARDGTDNRASAIAAAARRLFETIGVWEQVAGDAQPILDMVVTDSHLHDAVRPVFLSFGGTVEGEPFAHMIENGPLVAALTAKARAEGVELRAAAVTSFEGASLPRSQPNSGLPEFGRPFRPKSETSNFGWRVAGEAGRVGAEHPSEEVAADRLLVHLSDGTPANPRLLVAADGARSAIREHAGIATFGWDYGQSAIVTTVAHERDHNGRAEEHFLPAGPFAILPLKGRRASLVWTEETREAERIVALPDADFHVELERRFGLHLGEITAAGPRRTYPLGLQVARSFIAERLALVGDAAHVIHPIAGQGLNMGLRDVAALAEAIVDAARLGLDIGGAHVLDRYQRWRRFDTMAMGVTTDGLNRLFSNQSEALRVVRDVGLGLVDRMPALKSLFMREAAGLVGEVPKLLRGETL